MRQNNKKKNTFVAENACGSHFFCNLHPISEKASIGEMLEWLQRYDKLFCYNNFIPTFSPYLYLILYNKKDAGMYCTDTPFFAIVS